MSQPENEAPGPHTDRNPGTPEREASELPAAQSGARRTSSHPPGSADTLLSLPTPAKREEILDERLSAVESRLGELTRRLDALERRSIHLGENPERPRWIWLAFLAVLALAWQIMARFR